MMNINLHDCSVDFVIVTLIWHLAIDSLTHYSITKHHEWGSTITTSFIDRESSTTWSSILLWTVSRTRIWIHIRMNIARGTRRTSSYPWTEEIWQLQPMIPSMPNRKTECSNSKLDIPAWWHNTPESTSCFCSKRMWANILPRNNVCDRSTLDPTPSSPGGM